MKIQVSSKKVLNQDAFSTVAQLNFVLRIFGLSSIYRDGNKLKHNNPIWKFMLYIIVFFAANAYGVYFKIQTIDNHSKFTLTDAVQLVYLLGYIQYIFDIISVYKHGRQTYISYFNLYDYIDSIIGMPYYNQVKKYIRSMCAFYTFIALIKFVIAIFMWAVDFNFIVLNIYSVELIYPVIRLLAALDIIANCIQISCRLETIGDILEYYYHHDGNIPVVVTGITYDQISVTKDLKQLNYLDPMKISSKLSHSMMRHASRCYILLVEQSEFLNLKYGFRILVACSLYLLDVVLLLNIIIRLLMGNMVYPDLPSYLVILSSLERMLSYTITLFCGIYQCEQTYRQTERIVRMINHLLVNQKIEKEIREMLMELKDVIISRPITYHAVNFFRVDYATLVSMASVIVTYTIIFLQSLQ
ncbi:unnamed protein product [Euphydryas editha]|uniref:Gustatory receptor n=1 Tax=Euphydryas editha TaxID=104508 RepID=A0AAU9TU93_EUPED|nr:unnamed protein product [Euphydryas editha]